MGSKHTVELKKDPRLLKGDRLIIVDGVSWGQTVMSHHGVHGTKYRFRQSGNNHILTEIAPSVGGRMREYDIEVRSDSKRRSRWKHKNEPWRPTEEKVLDKARELVATGKLRHPDIVKEENRQADLRHKATVEAADARQRETFRNKAMEVMGINDPSSEIISRVVEAMEWAQSQ